ncbi:MAG: DNA polymerase III subunit beta [Rhodobacteraceae bacterium]|nr:DNA polymerase III subunit beta [Paracoccaceae bacterium]
MKFSINAGTLNNVANRLRTVVNSKSLKVILQNVAIEAESSRVRFTATDLISQMEIEVPVVPEQVGATTISARILADLAKVQHPESSVTVSQEPEAKKLRLSSGHANYELVPLPIADFPKYGEEKFDKTFSISPAVIHRLFSRTRYAISKDETRRYLNGVYLECTDDDPAMLVAVGLDGFQMAIVETEATEGTTDIPGSIIPSKLVDEFARIPLDASDVEISLSESLIQFKNQSMRFISRLVDGVYPNYRKLMPTNTEVKAVFEARHLVEALNRVVTVSKESHCGVNMTLQKGAMKLEVLTAGQGRAEDEIPLGFDEEENFKIRFGSRNLMNVLDLMHDSTVTLCMRRHEGASIMLDSADPQSKHVIMPIRL